MTIVPNAHSIVTSPAYTQTLTFLCQPNTSSAFVSAVAAAVTGAVVDTGSVTSVVLTRNPSATPTMEPTKAPTMAPVVSDISPAAPTKKNGDGENSGFTTAAFAVSAALVIFAFGAGAFFGFYWHKKSSSKAADVMPIEAEEGMELTKNSNSDKLGGSSAKEKCVAFLTDRVRLNNGNDVYDQLQDAIGEELLFEGGPFAWHTNKSYSTILTVYCIFYRSLGFENCLGPAAGEHWAYED